MGFFDKFIKFFSVKKQASVSEINYTAQKLVIDGKEIDFPIHIEILSEILGKPRATEFETDDELRAWLEKSEGVGMVTRRVNYAWDDLGLLAYTNNGTVAKCFSVLLKPSDLKYAPRSVYKGKLTINGNDWFSAMKTGENGQFLSEYVLGDYKITAEKSDFSKDVSECSSEDFNCVDIQILRR